MDDPEPASHHAGMSSSLRPAVQMAAAMALAGTIGWFVLVSGCSTPELVFWRCAIGAVVLFAVGAPGGLFRKAPSRRVLALSAAGGIALVLNWILLFEAYRRTSLSISTAVYNSQPFILMGLAAALFGERLTLEDLAWLGAAFIGLLWLTAAHDHGAAASATYLAGVALALGAAFFWAIAALVARRLGSEPPLVTVFIQLVVGAILLGPFALHAARAGVPLRWGVLLIIGAVHTGLVFVLMYDAVRKLPTAVQGALSFLYPVVATLVDVTAFGRRLHPAQLGGMALIVVAAVGLNIRRNTKRPTSAPALRPGARAATIQSRAKEC